MRTSAIIEVMNAGARLVRVHEIATSATACTRSAIWITTKMNLRWLWLNHVPPGLNLSPEQRGEVVRRVRTHRKKEQNYRGSLRAARRAIMVLIVPLSLAFTVWVFALVGLRLQVAAFVVTNVGGILLFNLLVWMTIAYGIYKSSVPYVRKALCDIGQPVCMECGYILRGLHERQACPECGALPGQPQSTNST